MTAKPSVLVVSLGGRTYIDQESLLDFLDERAKLVLKRLRVHDTSLTDTEYLRGQSFEQEIIKDAILPPTQTT